AVALGVPRDATYRHVDAEAGGGALLFRLASPEAVLALLARPLATGFHDRAGMADRASPCLAHDPSLGPLPCRREEQAGLPLTGGGARPGQRSGEDQVGDDGFGGHGTSCFA